MNSEIVIVYFVLIAVSFFIIGYCFFDKKNNKKINKIKKMYQKTYNNDINKILKTLKKHKF